MSIDISLQTLFTAFQHTVNTVTEQHGLTFGNSFLSFNTLNQRSYDLTCTLQSHGLKSSDVIAIHLLNGLELVLIH